MFEVEHLCNGWVKKDAVNLIQSNAIAVTYDTRIDFAFSPCLSEMILSRKIIFVCLFWDLVQNFQHKLINKKLINW